MILADSLFAMKNLNSDFTRGFTLIEVMVAVAIAAIVLSIGVPSFAQMVKNGRIASTASCLTGALYTARSEAVKRSASVTVCPLDDAEGAQNCGSDWGKGMLVFTEGNSAATTPDLIEADVDSDSTVLRACPAPNENLTILAKGSTDRTASSVSARKFIRYSRDGSSNWNLGSFTICDERSSDKWKALNVGLSGDIRVARFNSDGSARLDAFSQPIGACS